MNVRVSDLRPNPFRDLAVYPIQREKVEALKASIRTTGFWDNLLGRIMGDGSIQIAYGHQRLQALKELIDERVIDEYFIIEIPVRKIDDATMLRIMLQENPEIIAGVHVTREFLHRETQTPRDEILAEDICQFLGGTWQREERKVRKALKQLAERNRA